MPYIYGGDALKFEIGIIKDKFSLDIHIILLILILFMILLNQYKFKILRALPILHPIHVVRLKVNASNEPREVNNLIFHFKFKYN